MMKSILKFIDSDCLQTCIKLINWPLIDHFLQNACARFRNRREWNDPFSGALLQNSGSWSTFLVFINWNLAQFKRTLCCNKSNPCCIQLNAGGGGSRRVRAVERGSKTLFISVHLAIKNRLIIEKEIYVKQA